MYHALKRIFDIVLSILLVCILSPVALIVAVLIKIESSGPVFFNQARTGRFEQPFYILKFRTMYHESTGLNITASSDSRITRVGRILRKTKLDEIPQLLNVLKGEMSIVGPRPEVLSHLPYYDQEAKKIIFAYRPGITDLASLLYIHEERLLAESNDPLKTYFEVILPEKNRLRVRHLVQESFLFDIKVFIWTGLKILLRNHMPVIDCPEDVKRTPPLKVMIHEHSETNKDAA
ncbi:sugar transferase [Aquirhabdus parva]|uniref:Sugar transferase n=1 Tax=Aquirhabdus parva TaxID=2283318 RepID=A0A345PAG2_9GAMM|nr:sugar transferase [Aquirhabdus parva]AXI04271.1 sugar transferase [Aquirhabdus parva]